MLTEEPKPAEGYVYFIQAAKGGPIKIGTARNPIKRLGHLQGGNPDELRILGVMAGGRNLEAQLHAVFARACLQGEWFHPVPDLLELIDREAKPPPRRYRRRKASQLRSGWINPCSECGLPAPEDATCCQLCDSVRQAA